MDIESVIRLAREELDTRDHVREKLIAGSRDVVRLTKQVIASTHLRQLGKAQRLLAKPQHQLQRLKEVSEGYTDLYYGGILATAQQEVAEAAILLSLVRGEGYPELDDKLVPYAAYVQGLSDTVGELRRECLDALRGRDLNEAEELFDKMEEIHHGLSTLSYPSGMLPGFRHKCDTVRRLVEETRGDLTHASLMLDVKGRRKRRK